MSRTRAVRLPAVLDSLVVSEADRRGVPIQRILQDAVAERYGKPQSVEDARVPEVGPEPLAVTKSKGEVVLEGRLDPSVFESQPEVEKSRRVGLTSGIVRCQCVVKRPQENFRCPDCGKVR